MYLSRDYLRGLGVLRQREGAYASSYVDRFLLTDMGTVAGRFTRGASLSLDKAQREIRGDRQARYSVAGGPPTTGDFTDVSNLGFASTYIESFGGTKDGDAQFFDALNQFGDRHYLPGLGLLLTRESNQLQFGSRQQTSGRSVPAKRRGQQSGKPAPGIMGGGSNQPGTPELLEDIPRWQRDVEECFAEGFATCYEGNLDLLGDLQAILEGSDFAECMLDCLPAGAGGDVALYVLCLLLCLGAKEWEDVVYEEMLWELLTTLVGVVAWDCVCEYLMMCLMASPSDWVAVEAGQCCYDVYIAGMYNGEEIKEEEKFNAFLDCIEEIGCPLPEPIPYGRPRPTALSSHLPAIVMSKALRLDRPEVIT